MRSAKKTKIIHTVDLNTLTALCWLTVHRVTFLLHLSPLLNWNSHCSKQWTDSRIQ